MLRSLNRSKEHPGLGSHFSPSTLWWNFSLCTSSLAISPLADSTAYDGPLNVSSGPVSCLFHFPSPIPSWAGKSWLVAHHWMTLFYEVCSPPAEVPWLERWGSVMCLSGCRTAYVSEDCRHLKAAMKIPSALNKGYFLLSFSYKLTSAHFLISESRSVIQYIYFTTEIHVEINLSFRL